MACNLKVYRKAVTYNGKGNNIYHYFTLKTNNMGNLLYTIAVILVIIWAIGYLGFAAGNIIHILLVIAAIAIIFRLIQGKRV